MQMNRRMEILAPAGDAEMLRAAVYSGADCVYLGVRGFNARRGAQNFGGQQLAQAVAFCHARDCLVYAAVNTLVLPGREEEMHDAVRMVADAGCDAVIVQDLATAQAVKRLAPGVALHASTQMSVHSLAGAQQLAELGFSRVILARELSEEEIAYIAKNAQIETEVFVHGALCMSVSGQCYMSAFLGGRSANRGACAGPCRLPFAACMADAEDDVQGNKALPQGQSGEDCYHLSLKDLSILKALPRLEQAGVASIKIEGRLRGPEYCAVVVDAARKARDGKPYDEGLLQDVFSRSGFTDAWFKGEVTEKQFGVRTEADTKAAKTALPKARELYRREMPRVPVEMALRLTTDGASLRVMDGNREVELAAKQALQPALKDAAPALAEALAKTGGTPFYLEGQPQVETGGLFLPTAVASNLRRGALEALLQKRSETYEEKTRENWSEDTDNANDAEIGEILDVNHPAGKTDKALVQAAFGQGILGQEGIDQGLFDQDFPNHIKDLIKKRTSAGRPLLRARFEHVAQMPMVAEECCEALLLPLWEAHLVPEHLRAKTWLWLPRVLFGGMEQEAARRIAAVRGQGFAGLEVQNIAHFKLGAGLPLSAGFGLNVTNPAALAAVARLGCQAATLSFELSLRQMRELVEKSDQKAMPCTDALVYGRVPLMVTRACPLQNVTDCKNCDGQGVLVDRKKAVFPVLCSAGVRSVLNSVPLWMADVLEEMPTTYGTLYFTTETHDEAGDILNSFVNKASTLQAFTRGLYRKGTEE